MGEQPSTRIPVTYDSCARIAGPFYHGTKSAIEVGAELVAGHGSNFQDGRVSNNIYFSALVETAAWGAELSTALAGIEGGQALEGSLDQLDGFAARGVRSLGLLHFTANAIGRPAFGVGATTDGACGHLIRMKAGRSAGWCSSTTSWSDWLSWPEARVVGLRIGDLALAQWDS